MERKNYVIALGRECGSGGCDVGRKVAETLGIPYYDKELLEVAAKASGLSGNFLKEYDEKPNRSFLYSLVMNPQNGISAMSAGKSVDDMAYDALRDALNLVAAKGPCVIVGRGADYILQRDHNVVSVFISGEEESKIKYIMDLDLLTRAEAEKKIARVDRSRAAFYNGYSDRHWGQASAYDLCFRHSENLSLDNIAAMIVDYIQNRFLLER